MLKQSRPERKCLKAAKDHFTSAKLLYTDLRDIFYKTLHWDLNSHVPLLTVVHFVLQYLPKIYILSPSPFFPPVVFSSLLSICSSVSSPNAPRRGRCRLGGRCWRRSGGGERRPRGGSRMRRPTGWGWWRRRWRWERNTSRRSVEQREEKNGEERREGGDGRLGGEDERRGTKERLGRRWEDQRLSGKGRE